MKKPAPITSHDVRLRFCCSHSLRTLERRVAGVPYSPALTSAAR